MNRRDFLIAAPAVAAAATHAVTADPPPRCGLGLVIHSYWVRAKKPLPPAFPDVTAPAAFLAHAAAVGAAGVQTRISARDPAELATLRAAAADRGLYLEGIVTLPADAADLPRFDAELAANAAGGVGVARTVCTPGRRYELFDTAEQFRAFAERSWASLKLAEPVAARHKVRLAVENHKDWRADEMAGWLKRLSSAWVGVCVDTGNSVALLEDPLATAAALAPFALSTHLKDMAVTAAADGFRLAEVPFGAGFLDLPRMVGVLRAANPAIRLNLEMITRDPLSVPCLTPKYWATLGEVRGRELAEALARVREHPPAAPSPEVSKLGHAEQLRLEDANIARCLEYARANRL